MPRGRGSEPQMKNIFATLALIAIYAILIGVVIVIFVGAVILGLEIGEALR